MKTHNLNKVIGVVEVEPLANRFKLFDDEQPYLSYFVGTDTRRLYLNERGWQFLSTSKDMTEEMAKIIMPRLLVQKVHLYRDFSQSYEAYSFPTALQSLRSWERANGYTQDGDCSNQWCDNGKIDVGYGEHIFCEICGGSGSQQKVVNIAYLIKG